VHCCLPHHLGFFNFCCFFYHVLLQGQLLAGLVGPLDHIMGLKDARSTALKLVQYARSVPGLTSVLLGQKVGVMAGCLKIVDVAVWVVGSGSQMAAGNMLPVVLC
jgi:hypothetical protein